MRTTQAIPVVAVLFVGCTFLTNLDRLGDRPDASTQVDAASDIVAADADASTLADPIDVAIGTNHACALTRDGRVFCWGANPNGELAQDTNVALSLVPMQVPAIADAKAISVGDTHSCVIRASDVLSCWGNNQGGQLGVPLLKTGPRSTKPVDVEGLGGGVISVSAGFGYTCAIRKDLQPFCFGVPPSKCAAGLALDAGVADPAAPRPLDGGAFLAVAAAYDHTCFASSPFKNTYCMGIGGFGQLGQPPSNTTCHGLGSAGASGTPLVTGRLHTCVLRNGSVDCWGGNTSGQIADVTPFSTNVPSSIKNWKTPPMKAIATKWLTTCAIAADKTVECVGSNTSSNLGRSVDAGDSDTVPDKVQGISGAVAVAVGTASACAIVEATPRKRIYCWGSNLKGLLGSGADGGTFSAPVQVALPE